MSPAEAEAIQQITAALPRQFVTQTRALKPIPTAREPDIRAR